MAWDLERRLLLVTSALHRNQTVAALELSTHAALVLGWRWGDVHATALRNAGLTLAGSVGPGRAGGRSGTGTGSSSPGATGPCWDAVAVLNVLSDPDTWPGEQGGCVPPIGGGRPPAAPPPAVGAMPLHASQGASPNAIACPERGPATLLRSTQVSCCTCSDLLTRRPCSEAMQRSLAKLPPCRAHPHCPQTATPWRLSCTTAPWLTPGNQTWKTSSRALESMHTQKPPTATRNCWWGRHLGRQTKSWARLWR